MADTTAMENVDTTINTAVPVDIDPDWDGAQDSIYEGTSSDGSATTSIGSSVFCFTYANGRRYHSDRFNTQYFMPNDENEQDRLDLYHHIFLTLLDGRLHAAPLEAPQRILDIGTGTGIWAMDMADENPQAEIIGTDVSPIQPNWVPPNCRFEVDDMEEEWTFPRDYFDYVHIRSLSGSFKDWDAILLKAYNYIEAGGYVEFQDYGCEVFRSDGSMVTADDINNPLGLYFSHVTKAALKIDRPLIVARGIKAKMEAAGFRDVVEIKKTWPIGDWPKDPRLKELGKWGRMGALDSLYPFSVGLLTRVENWTLEQVQELCDSVRKDLGKGGGKYYCEGWFIYGKKPINLRTK
ncbi:S-adenosyl-L-methionine-dependent methyltransferase [Peziza echinospora]|nr:S-adenosyl-L-methionine-dependent methyltransferase [Peziza echinospora]